jgi:hypothetical protein
MKSSDDSNEALGIKHWLYQVIPPLSMLGVLFATNKGTGLIYFAGILLFPALISFFSVIIKLIFFKKKKYFLIRPCLTIVIFGLVFAIAQWPYDIALEDAISSAKIIHQQCNDDLVCPERPEGWEVDDSRIRRNDLGSWFKYSASYQYNENNFDINVYKMPDLGGNITGGVDVPFEVTDYVEEIVY